MAVEKLGFGSSPDHTRNTTLGLIPINMYMYLFMQPIIDELTKNEKIRRIFRVLPKRLQMLLIASWSFIKAHLNKHFKNYELEADFDYNPQEDLALFRFIIYVEKITPQTMEYWEKLSRDFENYLEDLGEDGKYYSKFIYLVFLPR